MANVDLHAIVHLADRVAFDMKDAATPDVLAFFSRLEQYLYAIPGLGDAVVSLKAGWLWFRAGDEAGCESLLAPLHTRELSSVKYASLLELYLEFYGGVAPVTRQLRIVERILELHNSDFFPAAAQLLHYAIVKGLFSFMLGDHEAMLRIINEAVTRHLAEVEAKDDIYSLNVAALTHQLLWRISADPSKLGKAIDLLQRILELPDITAKGLEDFRFSLGMLLAESGAYSAAIDNFERAGESVAAQVNLADAYAHIGRVDDADGVLKRIDRERVHDSLKLECISAVALVATKRGDIKAVNALIDEARSLNLPDLYFQRSRDQLCISLLEFATGKQNAVRTAAEKKVRGILGWIRYISQFLEIKPNVMGLGVNVNRLLEELPAKK